MTDFRTKRVSVECVVEAASLPLMSISILGFFPPNGMPSSINVRALTEKVETAVAKIAAECLSFGEVSDAK